MVLRGEDPWLWEDPRGHWHMVFELYDADRSGRVDRREFFDALKYLGAGLSWEDAGVCFAMIDADGGGTVCETEFINYYAANF